MRRRLVMLFGYTGKILHVDLTKGTLDVEQPTEEFYRTYVGGSALGLYYLLKLTPPGVDPLEPQNTLIFSLASATGAPISGQSRVTVTAKSPLTDAVGDSQAGGYFPAELALPESAAGGTLHRHQLRGHSRHAARK